MVISGSNLVYTPSANFNGSDSFTYTINDGTGLTDTATVSVTVTAVNDNPVANDDSATTEEDVAVTISLVANDTDIDGDSLSIESVGTASNGSVVNNGNGTVTYTPMRASLAVTRLPTWLAMVLRPTPPRSVLP